MNGKAQRGVPDEPLADAAQAFAARARQLGADSKRALKLTRRAFERFGVATDIWPNQRPERGQARWGARGCHQGRIGQSNESATRE